MRKNVASQRVTFSLFKAGARIENPTIAAGDFKVKLDAGAQNNVATLPTSDAAGIVTWLPSQAETNADLVTLAALDVLGDEWEPLTITFDTQTDTAVATVLADYARRTGDYSTLTQANILSDATPFAGANINAAINSRAVAGDAMTLTAAYDAAKTAAQAGDEMALTATALEDVDTELSGTHGDGSWEDAGGGGDEATLLAIKAKTDRIGTGKATLVAPVNRVSEVAVVQGRAYAAAYGNRLEWSEPTFNIAVDSVLVVTIHTVGNYVATRLTATALGLELTSAQTLALPPGNLRYSIDEHKVGGEVIPYVYSAPWRVDPQPTPVYTP